MTTPQHVTRAGTCPVAHGSPIDTDGPRVALDSSEFAADPHQAYRKMRHQYGSLVPVDLAVGVPATLVIGYDTARRILYDPEHFPADPGRWQQNVPADCPILPMLESRPNALRSAGQEHARYRRPNIAAIGAVDLHALHDTVEEIALALINTFCGRGSADLIGDYAFPLTFAVLNATLGCPPDIGQRLVGAFAAMFEGTDAGTVNWTLMAALSDLITRKRAEPGDDITSRLLADPAALDDAELINQLLTMYAAGIEPLQNLIVNTLLLMLTDERFAGDILGGALTTRAALDHVLFADPPLANHCVTYPRQPILIDTVWLPADQPVLISISGCNNDPAISAGDYTDNRSHLAWSAGPHACPAQAAAYLIAQDAIDQLLDALPEMRLACPADELSWWPGPFHRAVAAPPVTFPESPPLTIR
ncbi:cytochrome P450 [Nocardia sp. NBC_01730]|uniref:cytochrome P450 n=1 Tax=Nocardia sp. NBC_01730 TaxID=2975998 RepID=UPI002E0F4E4C|nr:cytochrome P450 [Nocardia sp. NBC_01730]